MGPEEVRFLLVHHTATNTSHSADDVPDILRGIYEFHTGPDKGWPDVCYHFFVDRTGTVWEGRAGSIAGPVMADATGGNQGYAQLVCLIGDFTNELPSSEALHALARVLAWLGERYAIDTAPGSTVTFVSRGSNRWPVGQTVTTTTISGHRDMSATGCPGDTFYPLLIDEFPARVTALRESATTTTTSPPTPADQTTLPPATTPPSSSSTSGPLPLTVPATIDTQRSTTTSPTSTETNAVPTVMSSPDTLPSVEPEGTARPATDRRGGSWLIGGASAVAVAGAAAIVTVWRRGTRDRPRDIEDGLPHDE